MQKKMETTIRSSGLRVGMEAWNPPVDLMAIYLDPQQNELGHRDLGAIVELRVEKQ